MRAGGIFGGHALGELGPNAFSDAIQKARWAGCSDAQQGKASAVGNVMGFLEDLWASDEQKRAASDAYAEGYNGCKIATPKAYPAPVTTTEPSSIVGPMPDTGSGKACTSPEVIASVQGQVGAKADGKWGPASQAALSKTGKTFKAFAPQCEGAVPYYSGSGGGTLTTSDQAAPIPPPPSGGLNLSSMTSSPVFWAALLVAGVGGWIYLSGGKKGK